MSMIDRSGIADNTDMIADLFLYNGRIITVNNDFDIEQAVAISGNKIVAVGKTIDLKRYVGAITQQIDLKGKTVIPGLIDEHCHPEEASEFDMFTETPDVHNVEDLLKWISQQVEIKKRGEWIVHNRFFFTRMKEMRYPTIGELDTVAPDNPVFLDGGYGGVINSAALKISGIRDHLNDPGLLKDEKSGQPTGYLRRSAFNLLSIPVMPDYSDEERIGALQTIFKKYNSIGITSITSGIGDGNYLRRYKKMAERGILTVRVFQNYLPELDKSMSREAIIESLKDLNVVTGQGDEWVKVGRLKVLLDGGILTGTAYMREPWGEAAKGIYHLESSSFMGIINYSEDELYKIVSAANELGWSFCAHATGGGGVDRLLGAYNRVNKEKSIENKRYSVIHGNFQNEHSIGMMKDLHILASVQPAWYFEDADAMRFILGERRVTYFNPFRSINRAGVKLCGGSDHMFRLDPNTSINPYNPFLGIWSMVTRCTINGSVVVPEETISREDALKAYTINNAFASFEEDIKGSLENGKLADLVVLSDDILTCDPDRIKDIQAEMTILDGKVVYEKK